jgi:hypothetical protein
MLALPYPGTSSSRIFALVLAAKILVLSVELLLTTITSSTHETLENSLIAFSMFVSSLKVGKTTPTDRPL